jgi:hypothetical protein
LKHRKTPKLKTKYTTIGFLDVRNIRGRADINPIIKTIVSNFMRIEETGSQNIKIHATEKLVTKTM